MADPDRAFWGGAVKLGGAKNIFTCLNTKDCLRQSLCVTQEAIFFRSKSGYFCWSNYTIFQRITTVWKRFVWLIQKTFETGPKEWASFFTSYTDLVYLQNVFKRYKTCCAQAFATVLAIPSEISEEQHLKRIPDLVRNRTVLLRLGSDNSCPTIGLK